MDTIFYGRCLENSKVGLTLAFGSQLVENESKENKKIADLMFVEKINLQVWGFSDKCQVEWENRKCGFVSILFMKVSIQFF